jgi:hypothetical protein
MMNLMPIPLESDNAPLTLSAFYAIALNGLLGLSLIVREFIGE